MQDIKNLKIAYIGGGSTGWAHVLMNDLAQDKDLAGTVCLYDIDCERAKMNEKIGNMLSAREDVVGKWKYTAVKTLQEALYKADFVLVSIFPATFDEMQSDVHAPEKYGIYQSVGDTTGPGGIVRALRTLPMIKDIALAVKEHCPNAWVINFTNPMTVIMRALYKVFPKIKAFGCCHEVFATQKLLAQVLKEKHGITAAREDIRINVVGVNHFTFITEAKYKSVDLFPLYKEYVDEHPNGIEPSAEAKHWANRAWVTTNQVKFDLFKRYGLIAAAGDRHLAEFCPGHWYLHDPQTVEKFGFSLTSVDWRKNVEYVRRVKRQQDEYHGAPLHLCDSGEESVRQMRALMGLGDFVTNVNLPNLGQIPNVPLGAVVETNAFFSGDSVRPLLAGDISAPLNALMMRIIEEQEMVVDAALDGDYEKAFVAFVNSPNVCLPVDKARELFDKMLYNTRSYLPHYNTYLESRKQ
jgi:alpha-galactosidase